MSETDATAPKIYDQDYFQKWYRDPKHRLITPKSLQRKVAMVVAMAEWHQGGPLRTVIDVGCGEGSWRAPLLKLRPNLEYLGFDASAYVVSRFGRRRDIYRMAFAELSGQRFNQSVDLVLCVDVMHYLSEAELLTGLPGLARLGHGVNYLEVMTQADQCEGDQVGFYPRSALWYRTQFRHAGLFAYGQHCYLPEPIFQNSTALERAEI